MTRLIISIALSKFIIANGLESICDEVGLQSISDISKADRCCNLIWHAANSMTIEQQKAGELAIYPVGDEGEAEKSWQQALGLLGRQNVN